MSERAQHDEQVTIALPICEPSHPRYARWSMADLARGICPECGCHVGSDPKVAREIRARHLTAELDEERLRRFDR